MKTALFLLATTLALPLAAAPPCEGVDRKLTEAERNDLAPVFAKEIGVKKTEVQNVFRIGTWSIFGVETYETDEWFLFYSDNPKKNHRVTDWGGAATRFEEEEIRAWVKENAPGIPSKLAGCFAWWVTQARE